MTISQTVVIHRDAERRMIFSATAEPVTPAGIIIESIKSNCLLKSVLGVDCELK